MPDSDRDGDGENVCVASTVGSASRRINNQGVFYNRVMYVYTLGSYPRRHTRV